MRCGKHFLQWLALSSKQEVVIFYSIMNYKKRKMKRVLKEVFEDFLLPL